MNKEEYTSDWKIQWKIYLVDGKIEINKACEMAKELAEKDDCEIMFSFPEWLKKKYPIAVKQQQIDYEITDNWSFLGINKSLIPPQ